MNSTRWTVTCLSAVITASAAAGTDANGETASEMARYLLRWHETGRFNGSALVAMDGEVLLKRGYGPANREWEIPNQADTRVRLGSISKQFTTVMVFQLVKEGLLALDDRLIDHLPDYRQDTGSRVTIDHLLRHTSGIPCYVRDSERRPDGRLRFSWSERFDREEFIRDQMSGDLHFEPGSQYRYSSTGHYLLALIIEKLTGLSYEDNLRQRICEPLGLADTGVDRADAIIPRRAEGYVKIPGGWAHCRAVYPPNLLGTGNLYSTVEDLLKWNLALRSGDLLTDEWREKLLGIYWREPREAHAYSLNYFNLHVSSGLEVQYTGFSGAMPGFSTDVFVFPDIDLIVALLDNSSQYNHWAIAPGIYRIVTGEPYVMPRPSAADLLAATVAERGAAAALEQHRSLQQHHPEEYALGSLERDLNILGHNALRADCLRDAIETFRLNVALFPQSWNVHDSLGEAYAKAGETELSRQCLAKAERIRGREDGLLSLLGSGRFDAAMKMIEEEHLEDPTLQVFTSSRIGPMLDAAIVAGDHEAALQICAAWAAGNPGILGPLFSEARTYREMSQTEKALDCYKRILQIAPEGRHVVRVQQFIRELQEAEDPEQD
ncbi:MAG: class A beta-lactamase-related serine hydrolase [Phycisphaerales bacterium]|nr:MAG: class A beta-lactamase-related serine hydrolase [Phycisphaerales bacterium]